MITDDTSNFPRILRFHKLRPDIRRAGEAVHVGLEVLLHNVKILCWTPPRAFGWVLDLVASLRSGQIGVQLFEKLRVLDEDMEFLLDSRNIRKRRPIDGGMLVVAAALRAGNVGSKYPGIPKHAAADHHAVAPRLRRVRERRRPI